MAEMNNKAMNPLAAGLAGAVIGAGVAMVTTRILTDQKMREKIMEAAAKAREKANMLMRGKEGNHTERVSHEIRGSRGRKSSRRDRTMNKVMAGARGAKKAMSM